MLYVSLQTQLIGQISRCACIRDTLRGRLVQITAIDMKYLMFAGVLIAATLASYSQQKSIDKSKAPDASAPKVVPNVPADLNNPKCVGSTLLTTDEITQLVTAHNRLRADLNL